ncbi:hypothetical protein C5E51_28095 [Nocardia nova]|uniref:DUF2637 domain-containing protein n=1 Tax=Nocardia nova TaxID=37330 RepID=UPI000CE9D018|nr:DUF2637 domain-containing protein [Nocardia nova]PPJ03335.1 hypothetical protein C5E51_28095 [Nocardia nova]
MNRITAIAVAAVAVVAAVVSYEHLYTVAEISGEHWRAWLLPLSVDGLVIAASLSAFRSKRNREPVHPMTKLSLATGLVVSVAANVLVPFLPAVSSGWLSAAVAAWPAVALALAFEELLRLRGTAEPEPLPLEPEPVDEPAEELEEPRPAVPAGTAGAETPRAAALRVALAEPGITGSALGARFARSDSWGRAVIREAKKNYQSELSLV